MASHDYTLQYNTIHWSFQNTKCVAVDTTEYRPAPGPGHASAPVSMLLLLLSLLQVVEATTTTVYDVREGLGEFQLRGLCRDYPPLQV